MSQQTYARGHFGQFGGRYVAETLMPALLELEQAYREAQVDPQFHREFDGYLREYVGRPSPLYLARRLTEHAGGAKIYLKREDLNHTGAHKVNNTVEQALLARRMGKRKVIAETGAGQHGVATATVAALFGMQCDVFMGEEDIRRQALNVFRMKLLGAKVHPVTSGTATLKDAMNEALRYWVTHVRDTFYVIGTVAGPHPYPDAGARFEGLIIPVLKSADTLTLEDISRGVKKLREKAEAGKFSSDDLTDGTFTISNLGMLGVADFAAIIYPPQTAILAISAIKDTPVLKDGSFMPVKMLRVTLSMDHRVVDGISAANFLRDLTRYLEKSDFETVAKPCCTVEDD